MDVHLPEKVDHPGTIYCFMNIMNSDSSFQILHSREVQYVILGAA